MNAKRSIAWVAAAAMCATASLPTVAATSWSFTSGTVLSGGVTATVSGFNATADTNSLTSTPITGWGNVQICDTTADPVATDSSCAAPQHAVDNNGGYEALLVKFDKAVTLTDLWLGYAQEGSGTTYANRADLSVLAYNGASALGTTSLPSLSAINSSLVGPSVAGWHLLGNYADVGTGSFKSLGNSSGISASYWLIAAFSQKLNGGSCTTTNLSCNDDYFKLTSVQGTVPPPPGGQVPEPSVLWLLGTALLGMVGLRRRDTVRAC